MERERACVFIFDEYYYAQATDTFPLTLTLSGSSEIQSNATALIIFPFECLKATTTTTAATAVITTLPDMKYHHLSGRLEPKYWRVLLK